MPGFSAVVNRLLFLVMMEYRMPCRLADHGLSMLSPFDNPTALLAHARKHISDLEYHISIMPFSRLLSHSLTMLIQILQSSPSATLLMM
jgi:hypothetical protein